MDITTERPNRIAYKGLYLKWRGIALVAIALWLATTAWLVKTSMAYMRTIPPGVYAEMEVGK